MEDTALYFYHPDHLGSSSWITHTDGTAIEHLHYLPYGETQVDQRATSYAARYTFSAKEKDEETGLSYFGSRYYSSELSIWLSVDPMSDKYPNTSPYVYCRNNPLILVDPDGREVVIVGDQVEAAFKSLQSGTNLKLSMDENGKISASGDAQNDNDQQLLDAINSTDVTANINTGNQYGPGEYNGTTYNEKTKSAESWNNINIYKMQSLEKEGASGSGMMHEITEGYQMGLIAINETSSISPAEWTPGEVTIGAGNMEHTIPTRIYKNPHDYFLYSTGHTRATRAPNEMSNKQASSYKSAQDKYFLPILERNLESFREQMQYR